jgi:hypothetical protein
MLAKPGDKAIQSDGVIQNDREREQRSGQRIGGIHRPKVGVIYDGQRHEQKNVGAKTCEHARAKRL